MDSRKQKCKRQLNCYSKPFGNSFGAMNQDEVVDSSSSLLDKDCVICTFPANGHNFGALSCRACAIFFRRLLANGVRYACKRGDGLCEINKSHRFFCRSCRFKKCLKSGMNPEKFQTNRDPLSSTLSRMDLSEETSHLYDFQRLMSELNTSFADVNMVTPTYLNMNALEKMEQGLITIRRRHQRQVFKINNGMNLADLTQTRLLAIKQCARWYMYSPLFRKLSNFDKLMIVKSTWHVWARLEKLSLSVQVFQERAIRERIAVVLPTQAIHVDITLGSILEEMGHKKSGVLDDTIQYLLSILFDQVAKSLLGLKPTPKEIAFLLCHVAWCVSSKILTGKALEEAESWMEQLSTNLHNHYTNERKMNNYALRLLKMISVVKVLQKTYIDYQRVMNEVDAFRRNGVPFG